MQRPSPISSASLQHLRPAFIFSNDQRHRPAQLPPSSTPPTHSSHHSAHLRRSKLSFRRLHRTVAASSSSSTNHHHHITVEESCTVTGVATCSSSNHHLRPLRFCSVCLHRHCTHLEEVLPVPLLMSAYFCPQSVFNSGYLIEFVCLKIDLIGISYNWVY